MILTIKRDIIVTQKIMIVIVGSMVILLYARRKKTYFIIGRLTLMYNNDTYNAYFRHDNSYNNTRYGDSRFS